MCALPQRGDIEGLSDDPTRNCPPSRGLVARIDHFAMDARAPMKQENMTSGADMADGPATEFDLPSRVLGQRIKQQRKALGLTLIQLAEKSGVSIATISKIENGLINGGFDTIYKIARGLGVLVNDLIKTNESAKSSVVIQKASIEPQHPTEYYDYYPQAMRTDGVLNPYIMTVKTRVAPPLVDWSNHEGEEFVHVIEGAIDLHHEGGPTQRLNAGDSATFDCGPAHCFVCVSADPAVIVSVSTRGITSSSPLVRKTKSPNPTRG